MLYTPQFFEDKTEIRKNMTGLTGTGKLILEFKTPKLQYDEYGNVCEYSYEYKKAFQKEVIKIVNILNGIGQ